MFCGLHVKVYIKILLMERELYMKFKVGVGKSDFEDLRKSNNYYVDKTDIMYELVKKRQPGYPVYQTAEIW